MQAIFISISVYFKGSLSKKDKYQFLLNLLKNRIVQSGDTLDQRENFTNGIWIKEDVDVLKTALHRIILYYYNQPEI
ncbi:hypothetical protein CWR45_06265 [Oceanobacillus chungangensis]|uniref:Uncharacterized protein n=1 Tax=Oceanobacillus chungangensis TaxID=1229152 RepID=A0A3D8PU50_9BACI|nr:hypothetical protein CWR45_06265 [Oceanobacillus chungangensis]